jgi:hypothetical protein
MSVKQKLLLLHIESVRVREASLRALGIAVNVPGNGLTVYFKKAWQAACEAEKAVYLSILKDRSPVISIRKRRQ